jgi:hypothetical protein
LLDKSRNPFCSSIDKSVFAKRISVSIILPFLTVVLDRPQQFEPPFPLTRSCVHGGFESDEPSFPNLLSYLVH